MSDTLLERTTKKPRPVNSEPQDWTIKGKQSMNITLWVLQALLAAAFLAHGWLLLSPPADLVEQMNAIMSPAFRIFLGVAEVLAAVGLTLPGITRIQPWLVACAAAGLLPVMVGATVLHVTRGELSSAFTTAVLLVLLTFVAYMRWKVKPILARTVA
jgi:uncharacterized membrane protein YphA (DoxX/SURF4 family)